ncbi:MAG: hypothetical protein GX567_14990 [Clostridia bacterium]|nr:hypothetical protein [Clostridia bacterium]
MAKKFKKFMMFAGFAAIAAAGAYYFLQKHETEQNKDCDEDPTDFFEDDSVTDTTAKELKREYVPLDFTASKTEQTDQIDQADQDEADE